MNAKILILLLCFWAPSLLGQDSTNVVLDSLNQPVISDTTVQNKLSFGQRLKIFPSKVAHFFKDEQPRPKKALWMTFILPGTGQAYNGKHWKIPIVYAGIGGLSYAIAYNTRNYKRFKTAYIYRLDGDENTVEEEFTSSLTDAQLQNVREGFRNNLERSYMGLIGFYALVGVDAFVDAHLQGFDVSDDLSWEIGPSVEQQDYSPIPSTGMGLTLTFGHRSPEVTPQLHPTFESITQSAVRP